MAKSKGSRPEEPDRTADDEQDREARDADAGEADAEERAAAEDEGDGRDEEDAPGRAARGDDGDEQDESAARVARALGVDEDEADAADAAEDEAAQQAADEKAAPPNRANRRREEALERRRKRRGAGGKADDGESPKDRNARARELLARRREQAAQGVGRAPSGLDAGEMVDDALARAMSSTTKWLRRNLHVVQWAVAGALLATGGYLLYDWRAEKAAGSSSSELAAAVAAERGKVMPEDKRSDDEKELDPTRIFKTSEERAEAAIAGYRKVIDQHPGTGAAILAKLGQAGALLAKKDHAGAIEAYGSVLSSPLAAADTDVKARAIEGVGFAKEGKGDLDGALASFADLEKVDGKGYKELAQYHQARILTAKGDKEKAKELLKAAREKLQTPSTEGAHPFQFLEAVVDESLRQLDPSAVPPPRTGLGGAKGGAISKEELERLIRMTREKKGAADPH